MNTDAPTQPPIPAQRIERAVEAIRYPLPYAVCALTDVEMARHTANEHRNAAVDAALATVRAALKEMEEERKDSIATIGSSSIPLARDLHIAKDLLGECAEGTVSSDTQDRIYSFLGINPED